MWKPGAGSIDGDGDVDGDAGDGERWVSLAGGMEKGAERSSGEPSRRSSRVKR